MSRPKVRTGSASVAARRKVLKSRVVHEICGHGAAGTGLVDGSTGSSVAETRLADAYRARPGAGAAAGAPEPQFPALGGTSIRPTAPETGPFAGVSAMAVPPFHKPPHKSGCRARSGRLGRPARLVAA